MPNTGTLSIGSGDAVGSDSTHTAPSLHAKRARPAEPDPAPKPNSGHRLVIQQDHETGEWIYTVTDRDTGEVVARIAREDVAQLGLKANYAAGALVKAKA